MPLKRTSIYRYPEDAYSLPMRLMVVILVVLRMFIFSMGRVQVCVCRVALILNVIMAITLNTWKTYQQVGLLEPNCK